MSRNFNKTQKRCNSMTQAFIPFALPDLGVEEINEVVDSMKSGWVTTGPKVQKFEAEFAKFIGCKIALTVNSATSGLHLALDAIGIKRDDKVIVPVTTFTATAEVVRYFDAHPVFCDIDSDTFNISVSALEKLLTTHPAGTFKAVIPVHMAGQASDMDEILALAHKHHLKVIEDAAHAFPTKYKGQMIGTLKSDITVFSFYATKTLCTAEGGMVVTENEDYAKRMKVMRLHGFDRDAWNRYNSKQASWFYSIVAPGFKYNMTDMAAAMGLHQLAKADRFFEKRQAMSERYGAFLKNVPGVCLPFTKRSDDQHAWHLYIISVPPKYRNEFIDKMREEGVGCSVHFIPLHLQPYWKEKYNLKDEDFPCAMKSFSGVVSLPLYTKMTLAEEERVLSSVQKVAKALWG